MEIDIITFTNEQYAALTELQIREVYEAQAKKDRLLWKLEETKAKEKNRLVKNGTFASGIWDAYCAHLEEECAREVESVRSSLLFYLRYTMRTESEAPYEVNYALTELERLQIVKKYYDETYSDPEERFQAFLADKVVTSYVGEYYAALWDYFYLKTEAGQNPQPIN